MTNHKMLERVDQGLDAVAVLPMLLPLLVLHDRLRARLHSDDDPEAGASLVEWVLITAVVITIALGVGVIIRNKLVNKAGELDFATP